VTNARFRSEFIINGDGKFLTLLDKDATQDAVVNCSNFNYATANDDYHQMFDVKPAQPKYEPRFRDSELYVKDKSGVLNENKNLKSEMLNQKDDLNAYFLMWLHQIKTPMTVSKLLLEKPDETTSTKLKMQLMYIEQYINMAMNYLKMIDYSTDMDITQVNLDDIIKNLLKKYSLLFIHNHISLEYQSNLTYVVSDSQWLTILIEQILSNALKYTENGKISMAIPTELIPTCPDDGSAMTTNLRVEYSFVEDDGWHKANEAYNEYIRSHKDARTLYLELGVGANTPVIIKYPFWQFVKSNENAAYACINYGEAFCPEAIEDRSICIDGDIGNVVELLKG